MVTELHTSTSLQEDINLVTSWSEKYQMSFNLAKCHVLHLGHNNPISEYTMYKCHEIKQTTAGTAYFLQFHTLEKVDEEVDLGVTVDDKLKFSKPSSIFNLHTYFRILFIKFVAYTIWIELVFRCLGFFGVLLKILK